MSDDGDDFWYEVVRTSTSLIMITGALCFAARFMRLKEKTHILKMIFILSISDFTYSFLSIMLVYIHEYGVSDGISYPIIVGASRFSLYWSAAICFFTYWLFVKQKTFDADEYIRRAFFVCFLVALAGGIMLYKEVWSLTAIKFPGGMTIMGFPDASLLEQILGWLIYHISGTLAAVILLVYCYSKVYQSLKRERIFNSKVNPSRVLVYIFMPILGFVPWVLSDTVVFFSRLDDYPFALGITVTTLRRIWGIFNLLIFWSLSQSRPEEENYEGSFGTASESSISVVDQKII